MVIIRNILVLSIILIVLSMGVSAAIGPSLTPEAAVEGYHNPLHVDKIKSSFGNSYIEVYPEILTIGIGIPVGGGEAWALAVDSTPGANRMVFNGGGNDVMVLDGANRRVGIGTATPLTRLNVRGSGWDGFLSLENAGTDGITKIVMATSGADSSMGLLFRNYYASGGETAFSFRDSGDVHLLDVRYDGNVGVGERYPDEKLDVAGNINSQGNLLASSGGLVIGRSSSPTTGMLGMLGTTLQVWDGSTWVDVSSTGGGPATGVSPLECFLSWRSILW